MSTLSQNLLWSGGGVTATLIYFPDGATTAANYLSHIPQDYSLGNLTINLMVLPSNANAGVAALRRTVQRWRDTMAVSTIDNTVNMNWTSTADTNAHLLTFAVASAGFAIGDALTFVFSRLGADASDTYTGNLSVEGAWMVYTGLL